MNIQSLCLNFSLSIFAIQIHKIVNIFTKNHVLFKNFSALSILKITEYIFPLITLPYLVRILGPEKFGLINFAQAFSTYFILFTEYGFKLSATREISINRNNKNKVSKIFCSIYLIKILLFFISLSFFLILVTNINRFSSEYLVFTFSFLAVVGNLLFPIWLFQGLEKMKYITIINVLVKAIFIIPIFLFINNQADYIYVPLINSLGLIASGLIAIIFSIKTFNIKITVPKYKEVKYQLTEGWYIFTSTIAISLYTTSYTFILGLLTNNTVVGHYSAAEKIINAFKSMLSPISQSVYPHVTLLVKKSKISALSFISKLFKAVFTSTLILSLLIAVFANPIVKIALGDQYQESILILRILSFVPFFVGLSNVLGVQTMLTFNYKKAFFKILSLVGLLSIILVTILTSILQHIGVAISMLVTEITITIVMFLYLHKKGFNFLKNIK